MSMDRCSSCLELVDTDDDPEAYVEVGNMRRQTETICLCYGCREARIVAEEIARREPDPDAEREKKRDDADWDRRNFIPTREEDY